MCSCWRLHSMSTARGVHTATQKVSSPAADQGECHYRSVREGSPRRGVECRVVPCAQRWQTDTGDAEGTMLPRCAAATTARLTARHCSSKPPPLKKEPAVRSSTAPTWSLRIGHRDRAKYQFSVLKLRKIQNFSRERGFTEPPVQHPHRSGRPHPASHIGRLAQTAARAPV